MPHADQPATPGKRLHRKSLLLLNNSQSSPLLLQQKGPRIPTKNAQGKDLRARSRPLFQRNGRAEYCPHQPHDATVDGDSAEQATADFAALLKVAGDRVKYV